MTAARDALGPLGVLVTCHCESVDSSILDTTVDSFDRHYAVNVRATWLLLKAFAEQVEPLAEMPDADGPGREEQPSPATGGGAVIALTSDNTVNNLPYGATKGAQDRLVHAGRVRSAEGRASGNAVQ